MLTQALGYRSVDDLRHNMTGNEFHLWGQYYRDPRGLQRVELMLAQVCALIVNVMGTPKTPAKVDNFLIKSKPDEPEQMTGEQLQAWAIRNKGVKKEK